jgi:hypothetical protein
MAFARPALPGIDEETMMATTKKITVKAPAKKLTAMAAKALKKGSPLGGRVEAEAEIAKKAAAKKKAR